jgi:hypothetical protein
VSYTPVPGPPTVSHETPAASAAETTPPTTGEAAETEDAE